MNQYITYISYTIPKKKYANFCSRDRNWLAGWPISLPVTEIGWLGPQTPISMGHNLTVAFFL